MLEKLLERNKQAVSGRYAVTSCEKDKKILRELETIAPLSNDCKDGDSASNLNDFDLIKKI